MQQDLSGEPSSSANYTGGSGTTMTKGSFPVFQRFQLFFWGHSSMSPAQIFYANLFTFKIFISCCEATDAIFFLKKKTIFVPELVLSKNFK